MYQNKANTKETITYLTTPKKKKNPTILTKEEIKPSDTAQRSDK